MSAAQRASVRLTYIMIFETAITFAALLMISGALLRVMRHEITLSAFCDKGARRAAHDDDAPVYARVKIEMIE